MFLKPYRVSELDELFSDDLNDDDYVMISHLAKKDAYGNRTNEKISMKMKVSELVKYVNRHKRF